MTYLVRDTHPTAIKNGWQLSQILVSRPFYDCLKVLKKFYKVWLYLMYSKINPMDFQHPTAWAALAAQSQFFLMRLYITLIKDFLIAHILRSERHLYRLYLKSYGRFSNESKSDFLSVKVSKLMIETQKVNIL